MAISEEKGSLIWLLETFNLSLHGTFAHPEFKSLAPDRKACKADSDGLLKRYPVTASGFHLIGQETERGWERNDDISTLMPSLVRYSQNNGVADDQVRKQLVEISLALLVSETGLSRHTIVRARRGQPVQPRSLRLLKGVVAGCQFESDLGFLARMPILFGFCNNRIFGLT